MKLNEQLHRWFLKDLFSTARGRAYVLSQAAEAESGERAPSSMYCSSTSMTPSSNAW